MSERTPRRRKTAIGAGGAEQAPLKEAFLPPQGQWFNSLEEHYILKQNEAVVAAGGKAPFPPTRSAISRKRIFCIIQT